MADDGAWCCAPDGVTSQFRGVPTYVRHAPFCVTSSRVMNDALLAQLKDAGFPVVTFRPHAGMEHRATDRPMGDGTVIQTPTLAELIEACVIFQRLLYDAERDRWQAAGATFTGEGMSPEEAVAHLWLQLNRHTP
jgi:hypothetical protein